MKICALKLVNEIILYYDARSKKHKINGTSGTTDFIVVLLQATCFDLYKGHLKAF